MLGIYVGLKEKAKPEIFESETALTKESYPQYAQKYIKAMGELACGEG